MPFLLLFFVNYLVMLAIVSEFFNANSFTCLKTTFFIISAFLVYSFVYLLPAFMLTLLHKGILALFRVNRNGKIYRFSVAGTAILTSSIACIFILGDRILFSKFGFHVNGFVWNLIVTPGGIESMGFDNQGYLSIIFFVLAVLVIQGTLFYGVAYVSRKWLELEDKHRKWIYRRTIAWVIMLTILGISGQILYGISQFTGDVPVLTAAEKVPFYLPTKFRKFAKKLGYKPTDMGNVTLLWKESSLQYPLNPIIQEEQRQKYNIVWLVAESWRADALNPEVMKETEHFSQKAFQFNKHYSGGNGTRQGVFSIFYGLYGTYWFSMLNNRRPPVFVDLLKKDNYQIDLYTSAMFTYPEFDKTIFATIEKEKMHQSAASGGFTADNDNVTQMLAFIKNRDPLRPFMTFMFFESPHAPYTFPDNCIVKKDFLPHINYATVDIAKNIEKIRNRYLNSCNHLDYQLGRIFRFLEEENLMDSTIVIVTGDHGEEFMEKGRWGHNSEFHEEQIRVPLLLYIPQKGSGKIDYATSHIDIIPTILPLMGVKNPKEDYCLGLNLFESEPRPFWIVSSWNFIGYIDGTYKYTTPINGYIAFVSTLSDANDNPIANTSNFRKEKMKNIAKLMENLGWFHSR